MSDIKNKIAEKDIKVVKLSPCISCVHKFTDAEGCIAFKESIPMDILLGKNRHTEPLPGQVNKIVFKRII